MVDLRIGSQSLAKDKGRSYMMTVIVAVLLFWARFDRAQCDSRDAFDGFLRRGQSAVETGYTVPYFLLGRGHGGNNEWLSFLKFQGHPRAPFK